MKMKIKQAAALLIGYSIAISNAQIVKNGYFEKWDNDKPANWQLGKGVYEKESVAKIEGQYSLRTKVDSSQKALYPYCKISQVITLEPDSRYKLSCYICKDGAGTHSIRLTPLEENGKSGKKSLFSISKWTWPMPYTCFEKEFISGKSKQYRLEILQYSKGKSYTYFDKIVIKPLKEKKIVQSGMGIFTQSSMLKFSDEIFHKKATSLNQLSFTITRNETESQTVILRSGNDYLPKTNIIPAGNLKSSSGQVIPAKNITIRSNIDSILPLASPRDLPADKLSCWQIFIKTTPDIPPGQYSGSLLVQSDSNTLKTIPVSVEIVDILLPEPRITFGTYHTFAYFPAEYISTDYMHKIFIDMKKHGMNSVTIYNNPEKSAKDTPDYKHNHQYNNKFLPEKDRNTISITEAWNKRFNIGLAEEMNMAIKTGLISQKHPVLWLVSKKGHYGWGGISTNILSQVLDYWKLQRNWPEPLLYVMDEPSGMPEREAIAKLYFARIAKARIKVKTVTSHPNPDTMGHLYDVWILGASKVNYRNFAKAVKMDRKFWMYNCSIPNNNAPYFRAMYGFSAWASNVSGVWAWAYYDAGDKFTKDKNGDIKDTSESRLSKVGLSLYGPVPTTAWEAMRDGTEDYRLAQLFLDLHQKAGSHYNSEMNKLKKVLSSREIAILKKHSTKEEVISKTASTPEKKAAIEKLLKLIELEKTLSIAYRAKSFLLDMIPNTLAPAERVPMEEWQADYVPDLGETERATAAETKRMALIPVIIKLQSFKYKDNF
jgi:hypothetical protein